MTPAPTPDALLRNVQQQLSLALEAVPVVDGALAVPRPYVERWHQLVSQARLLLNDPPVLLVEDPLAPIRGVVLGSLWASGFALGWFGCWVLS